MNVALDRGHHDPALGLVGEAAGLLFLFYERDEMRHRLLHHAGRFDHLGQEHLAAAEQIADYIHAVHERTFDHLDGARELLSRFFGILDHMRVDALHQRMLEPPRHRPAAPFRGLLLGARVVPFVAFGKVDQPLRGVAPAHQNHILAGFAQRRIDRVVDV